MELTELISAPDHPGLDRLCGELREGATQLGGVEDWPGDQLQRCARSGVFRWFLPARWDGLEFSAVDVVRGYLKLSAACLTTTFIITQRTGACRRILASDNHELQSRLLPPLADGRAFSTVGISHLTTSRQHLGRPAVEAVPRDDGYRVSGSVPWVTGAPFADHLVVGATLPDGRQILFHLPATAPGVAILPGHPLLALSASRTGPVQLEDVDVPAAHVLSGPIREVLKQGMGASTGGLQTSTLALGLARAAVDYLDEQAERRIDLRDKASALQAQWHETVTDLLDVAAGRPVCSNQQLRTRANSLVLRSTQAALAAAKGAGFISGHPAGRWCQEALFFLVWSCPQNVVDANLCELAGITG